jgi:hypothetical protein
MIKKDLFQKFTLMSQKHFQMNKHRRRTLNYWVSHVQYPLVDGIYLA